MPETISEVMTHDPRTVEPSATLPDVARIMRDARIGAVIVVEERCGRGLVTDRDIVVRGLAEGRDPDTTPVSAIASRDLRTLTLDRDIEDAMRLMREWEVRRVVVVQGGRPVGIVSLALAHAFGGPTSGGDGGSRAARVAPRAARGRAGLRP